MPKGKKFLNGEILFKEFCSMGAAANYAILARWAAINMPNPESGKVSRQGVLFAMWKWAFQNTEEAWLLWKEYRFHKDPSAPPYTKEEFLKEVRDMAEYPNIASKSDLERFCARYGLKRESKVGPQYIIQVTRPDHALFQRLLVVDSREDEFVHAHMFQPDGTITNHQLRMDEFGVVGKVAV